MKIILVANARPNFMKITPLISAIKKLNNSITLVNSSNPSTPINPIDCVLVHTGQHYDDVAMSETFFHELEIPKPDINLEVGSSSHAVQTAYTMIRFEEACLKEKPDWILVVGDLNSTMACTLVSAKLGIKVGHVEAGLRSCDRTMPETVKGLLTDTPSDLLFTLSEDANGNLLGREPSGDDNTNWKHRLHKPKFKLHYDRSLG